MKQIARLPRASAKARRVASGGGPTRLRVHGLGRPSGWILPSSRLKLEIEARNGTRTHWEPEIPVPFPYAWAYRLSRWLGAPVISSHNPEDLKFSVPLLARRSGRKS